MKLFCEALKIVVINVLFFLPIKIVPKDVLSLKEKLCQLSNTKDPGKLSYKTIDGFDLDLTNLSNTKHSLLIDVSSKIKKIRHLLFLLMMKIGLQYL